MAIERMNFLPNFGNEVSVKKGMKILGLRTPEFREHELVNELVDRPALHFDGFDGMYKSIVNEEQAKAVVVVVVVVVVVG